MFGKSPLLRILFALWLCLAANAAESRRAVATPQIVNGFVVGLNVVDGGAGYTTPPAVVIVGGGGSGATATAQVANGVVTGFTITDAGIGYTGAPEIRIASPHFQPSVAVTLSHVKVTLTLVLGQRYQLMSSGDLSQWTAVGEPFVADSETLLEEVAVQPAARYFTLAQLN